MVTWVKVKLSVVQIKPSPFKSWPKSCSWISLSPQVKELQFTIPSVPICMVSQLTISMPVEESVSECLIASLYFSTAVPSELAIPSTAYDSALLVKSPQEYCQSKLTALSWESTIAIFVLSLTIYKAPSESTQSWAPVIPASLVSVAIFVVAIDVVESIEQLPFKSWLKIDWI